MTNDTEDAVSVPKEASSAAQLIGGEIHIIADARTGGINVQSPPNLVVALGLLETAKVIIIQKHVDAMRAAEKPKILRASPQDIPKLVRPS
jgi:hypothetical protein